MVRVFADAAIVVKSSSFILISHFQEYAGTKLQGKNVSGEADWVGGLGFKGNMEDTKNIIHHVRYFNIAHYQKQLS
jgi:hypothetical protein